MPSSLPFRQTRCTASIEKWPILRCGESWYPTNGAASASAQYAQSPGTRCHIHGFGAGQWRTHLVALHHCEIRPEFSFVASLPLLQFPVTYEIGRYSAHRRKHLSGIHSLQRHFAFFLWVLMTLSFLWFGAFTAAGGTSLAALTDFPAGWPPRGQTLFWGYASMAVSSWRFCSARSFTSSSRPSCGA